MEENDGMAEIVGDYFRNIFAKSDMRPAIKEVVSPRLVSTTRNEKLMEEVTFEEFTRAINQMHPEKALGPDGLNPAFSEFLGHDGERGV